MIVVTHDDRERGEHESLWGQIERLNREIDSVDRTDIARRSALIAERDTIARRLRDEHADPGQLSEWAERSAPHRSDDPRPPISSPSEMGGGFG